MEALEQDYCQIAHKLMHDGVTPQLLERNGFVESDFEDKQDAVDVKIKELMESIDKVNTLLEEIVAWSRVVTTCSAVLLEQDSSFSNEDSNFAATKTRELQEKAEELKPTLEEAMTLIHDITVTCPHLDYLHYMAKQIKMFLAFTKELEKKQNENRLEPVYFQETLVLCSQLEKLLGTAELATDEDLMQNVNGNMENGHTPEENLYRRLALLGHWIDEKMDEMDATISFGGLPETAQDQLDKHLLLLEEIKEKEAEFEIMLSSNEIDNCNFGSKFNALKMAADSRKDKLEEILKEAILFHESLQSFMVWLSEAERKLKATNKLPISVLPEKLSTEIADQSSFEESFKERRVELLELDKMGSHLKYFAQKQDGVLIKNLLLSVHSRWDKLLSALASHSLAINDLYKKSKQFSETSQDLMDWVKSATKKLDSSLPHHIEDNDFAETEVKIFEDFQKALSSKQPIYNAVMRSGTILLEKAILFNDKAEINQILSEVKHQWHDLKQKSIQRKHQLEESLIFSGHFCDAINSIMEWLFTNEPVLADVQVHGDINTVNALIAKHNVLKNELKEQHLAVDALLQSLRDEQGEDWKSDHMQELLTKWEAVNKQADIKQALLDAAERQAKDLHSSAEQLLSHLSKVESNLHSKMKLPQDDFQLQELRLLHQAASADLNEKATEFERIVELANYILDRAHPDAVIPIRQLIKVLQAKWFEVQVKANARTSQIEETLKELEEDFKLIEDLKKWLSSTEHRLKEQNESQITPENIDNLTAELQAFQDAMTARQPDYDRVVGRYAARKTQPMTKKSPRGKTTKKDNESEPGVKLQCEKLQAQWNHVWLLTLERQKKLQEAKSTSTREPKASKGDGFDFESWRKKFMKWLKSRKLKPMEFFRAMDKDLDGTITREEFMEGLKQSNLPIKESEIKKVCDYFEQGSEESVDYYKLVAALYPAKEMMKHEKEADQIENEVVRQVAKCSCSKRFNVQQIAENKYRFGDNQQLRLVRILKSTVMVRVGGGWMALDEFLIKNDPCRGLTMSSDHFAPEVLETPDCKEKDQH